MDDQLKSDTWKGYSSHGHRSAHLVGSSVKKVVKEYKMISDWLANWECLGEYLMKVHIHIEDRKIRKEIFPSTKASPLKASSSEKLSNIERPHQPDTSFVCPSNATKKQFNFHIYIVYIIVTRLFQLILVGY